MSYNLRGTITVSQLAKTLDLKWHGLDGEIDSVAAIQDASKGNLTFASNVAVKASDATVICEEFSLDQKENSSFIFSKHPRFDFIRALSHLDKSIGFAMWEEETDFDSTVKVGKNVVIETGCSIGSQSVIEANVVIHKGTRIGANCRIRSGANIGGDGFGFERDHKGKLSRFLHLGGVEIGSNVEIGALNSIARGALGDTIIKSGVKTDNLVHIGHNCSVDENVLIAACAELSGGVCVGRNVWIGPSASIAEKVNIGADSFIGIGAVVTKDVKVGAAVAGNPARSIRRL